MNLGKPVNVPELSETMAIELGANLLGEMIIFSIGSGLLIFEYRRYARSHLLAVTGYSELIIGLHFTQTNEKRGG